MIRLKKMIVLLSAVVLTAGCTVSSKVSGSWSDPAHVPGQLSNIAVLVIAKQEIVRRNFEEQMAANIKTTGANANPTYRYVKDTTNMSKEEVSREMQSRSVDAVLVARVVDSRIEKSVSPGYSVGTGYRSGGWYGSYNSFSTVTHVPPSVSRYRVLTVDATLHRAEGENMIWTARIETTPTGDMTQSVNDLVEAIMADMQKKGVF